jgi:ankyrin repeat protein
MAGAKINAREVVNDIRSGMDDAALMEKYRLSAANLQVLFDKLVQAGVIKQSELDHRLPMFEGTVEVVFKFPEVDESRAKELGEQLIQASKRGVPREAARLVDRGANLNAKGTWGMTPLMWAASKGHAEVVRLLLERGADANAAANNSSTALMWTAFAGHNDLVKLLIERGAAINLQSNCGRTALISAAFNGHLDVVKLLLESGAQPNIKDEEGRTAIDYAIGRGHREVRDVILRYQRPGG